MVLNIADDVFIGDAQVSEVYAGDEEIWCAGTSFELDVTRFDPDDPKLYDTNGNVIGQVSMISGSIADNVYTVTDGLHVTGHTNCEIAVDLPKNKPWTIEYSIKDYEYIYPPNVNWFFNSSNATLEIAAVHNFNSHAIHCRLDGSSEPTLYNYCSLSGNSNGFYDFAIEPSMIYGFEMNFKWVNNGNTLSLWVNGIKKASLPSSDISGGGVSHIGVPNENNSIGSNSNTMVVTGLRVLNYADETNDRVLYKMHITEFRSYDPLFSLAKLCLYSSEGVRIDQNPDNYVAIFRNGGAAQDGVERTESLVYALLSKSQKGGVQYGAGYIGRPNGGAAADVIDIVFSVPANLPEVDSYSYITPVDPSEIYASRDPVRWTFQKSTDGGVTWTVLDTRSNVPNPGRGNETERFYIM